MENELKPIPLERLKPNPLVSILMANYNYAEFIGEAIESVMKQTYKNWELIICDDGSKDSSVEIIEKYQEKDSRIKLINKENGGMSSALNKAYELSKGEIICFLDSDDYYELVKVEKVVADFLSNSNCGVHFHSMMRVNEEGKYEGKTPLISKIPEGWLGDKVLTMGGSILHVPATSGITIRKDIADRVFLIDNELRSNCDAFIICASLILTSIKCNVETLAYYRLHNKNLSYAIKKKKNINDEIKYRKKELAITIRIYNLFNTWVERNYHGIKLGSINNNWHFLELNYVITKLRNKNKKEVKFWNDKLLSHPLTRNTKYLYLFYKISFLLRPSIFKLLLDIRTGHGNYKLFIEKIFRNN